MFAAVKLVLDCSKLRHPLLGKGGVRERQKYYERSSRGRKGNGPPLVTESGRRPNGVAR